MTCASCEALREKIAELECQLDARVGPERITKLRRKHYLSPNQASVLLTLYDAKGKAVALWRLHDNRFQVADHAKTLRSDDEMNDVRVMVYHIRRVLGRDVIQSISRVGYCITDKGAAIVEKALEG